MAEKAILIDTSKCMGCRGCQVSCKQWHELGAESTVNRGTYQNPPDLSPATWTVVKFREIAKNGQVEWLFRKHQCLHCTDAACVKVCPTGALTKHPDGFTAYDESKCSGCGYCSQFCPFDVPRLNTDVLTGKALMQKCTFCQERVTNGLTTSCSKTCPTGTIQFGERSVLVQAGQARVASLKKSRPEASLYGQSELGGLHVMYVLEEAPEKYDLPANPQFPAVAAIWQDIIQPLGQVVIGGTVLGLILNFAVATARIRRKKPEKVMEEVAVISEGQKKEGEK